MKIGSPTLTIDGTGLRVVVIAASWHETVMAGLISGARQGLTDAGVPRTTWCECQGASSSPSPPHDWLRTMTRSLPWVS